MISKIEHITNKQLLTVFYGLSSVVLLCLFLAIGTEERFFYLIPFLVVGGLLTILDYKYIYYILLIALPLSFSVYLGANAFAELPTEPIMVLFLLILLFRPFVTKNYDFSFNHHPISLFIIAQLLWLIPVTLNSTDIVLSLKYLVSKYWYVATFFYATSIFIKSIKDFKKIFWLLYIPLLLVTIINTIRHAFYNFEFYYANSVVNPFFINHVIYGAYLATILPLVYYAKYWYSKSSFAYKLLNYSFYFFIFAVIITYTRASWLALIIMFGTAFLLKNKLLKTTLFIGIIGISVGIGVLLHQNKYVDLAPNFETTIFHEGDIARHLESTYTFEDVSGMERIYRWVAAKNMILAKPWLGFGTNCFYDNYKHYSVLAFETYISDNKEKSTTHNYFIMLWAEQGFIGFLLFAGLCIALFILAQKYYHNAVEKEHKHLILAVTLSLTSIIFHLFLNDLIETDKLGTLFFFNLAVLTRLSILLKINY